MHNFQLQQSYKIILGILAILLLNILLTKNSSANYVPGSFSCPTDSFICQELDNGFVSSKAGKYIGQTTYLCPGTVEQIGFLVADSFTHKVSISFVLVPTDDLTNPTVSKTFSFDTYQNDGDDTPILATLSFEPVTVSSKQYYIGWKEQPFGTIYQHGYTSDTIIGNCVWANYNYLGQITDLDQPPYFCDDATYDTYDISYFIKGTIFDPNGCYTGTRPENLLNCNPTDWYCILMATFSTPNWEYVWNTAKENIHFEELKNKPPFGIITKTNEIFQTASNSSQNSAIPLPPDNFFPLSFYGSINSLFYILKISFGFLLSIYFIGYAFKRVRDVITAFN